MSIIIPANSAVGGGYDVDNSCRFNYASSDFLSRTISSSSDRQKFTISTWVKRSKITVRQQFIGQYLNAQNYFYTEFSADDTITIADATANALGYQLTTTQVFRDPSAWYHIIVAVDTTQGTANNRVKLYVNGLQVTVLSTNTQPSQNFSGSWNVGSSSAKTIGYRTAGFYFGGYIAETVFIDGSQNAVTDLGEFDEDSGIWKPISVSGLTFGTNGVYLDYGNSGSLGADVSGNGNNFTVNNLTAVDQSTDTCTNNGAVLNNLYSSSGTGFSEGNLNYTYSSSAWRSALSTIASNQGKWYMEIKKVSGTYAWFGVCGENLAETVSGSWMGNANGGSGTNIGWGAQSGNVESNGTNLGYFGGAMADGTIVGIALDLDNDYIYYSKDGSFINSGDPTSGSSGTGGFALPNKVALENYFFGFSSYAGSVLSTNFGSPSFAISSGNTDGNGYGNFEYAVPSGYYSLNTKNLSEYG